MRKLLLTVVASCALVAIMPASALAHGHKGHHHARVHHKTFGHDFSQSGSTSSGSTSSGSTSTPSSAGKVQSFDSSTGALTILLNDNKTTVTGTVTPGTEIECQAPDTSGSSGSWQGHDHGGDNGGGGQGDDDQGQGDDENNGNAQNCDTTALAPGTTVQEASLRISSAGATWDKIELVSSSTSTTSSSGSGDDD